MFFVIVLGSWAVMNAYVCWRVCSIPLVSERLGRKLVITSFAFMTLSFFIARTLEGFGWPARGFEFVAVTWIGILFLAFVCLFAADLVTLFGLLLPNTSQKIRGWALVLAAVLCVIALVQGIRSPVVESYEVRVNQLPQELDGAVIVLMSDMHLGSMQGEEWAAARVEQVMTLKPDMVVLCGDILEGDDPSESGSLQILRGMKAPLGVWAAPGNHESYAHERNSNGELESVGVRVLRNEWREVRPGLVLAGVEDLTHIRRNGTDPKAVVAKALSEAPSGSTLVLMSHSPLEAEFAATKGVSLMLSGHTHDGQIWPFDYFVQALYPHIAGEYKAQDMTLIVCRGTGTWGPRMRLWRRGEIAKITLRAPKAS